MNDGSPSATSGRLWIQVLIALVLAGVLTVIVTSATNAGATPAGGKPTLVLAVLVIPFVIGTKAAWSVPISVMFAFAVYFFLMWLLLKWLWRDREAP